MAKIIHEDTSIEWWSWGSKAVEKNQRQNTKENRSVLIDNEDRHNYQLGWSMLIAKLIQQEKGVGWILLIDWDEYDVDRDEDEHNEWMIHAKYVMRRIGGFDVWWFLAPLAVL